jgi:hypothetical protein
VQVVQQRAQRRHIQDGQATPLVVRHLRQQREERRFGLTAGSRSQQEAVITAAHRLDRLPLQGTEVGPAEGVDDVMQHARV